MEFFQTSAIDLSMYNPENAQKLQAHVYTLEGVVNEDGSLREMSIGQLVMAVCLNRATTLERDIVEMMDDMAVNTDNLDALSTAEEALVAQTGTDKFSGDDIALPRSVVLNGATLTTVQGVLTALSVDYSTAMTYDDVITNLEEKIDSFNTVSQEQLIEMQSLTSKRDDTYSLVSNVLKSLYTVLTGNANNL